MSATAQSEPEAQAIPPSWREALASVLAEPGARKLGGWLKAEEAAGKRVFPPPGRGCERWS